MEQRKFIEFLNTIEKLKNTPRHSWNADGRRESVAEHCWRTAVMALLIGDEFPQADMEKVVKMCLIHDFGEAVTGDIPAFEKTEEDEKVESSAVKQLLSTLPVGLKDEFSALFEEMDALKTTEAKIFKALDNMEAVVTHNESPLSSWVELEYSENLVYGAKNVEWSPWFLALKEQLNRDSIEKIEKEGKK